MHTVKMLTALAMLALTGCRVGPGGADLQVAKQPGGASVSLRTASGAYSGELIAVQNDGVFISNGRVMFAPFSAMTGFVVERMSGHYQLRGGEIPTSGKRARLSAVSRFPQGLTSGIEARLLELKNQTEVVVIR